MLFSEDLSLGLVVPVHGKSASVLAEPPLSPPVGFEAGGKKVVEAEDEQEKTIYLHQDAPVSPRDPKPALEQTSYEEAAENGAIEAELTPKPSGRAASWRCSRAPTSPRARISAASVQKPAKPLLLFRDASHNLAHVVVSSSVPLTAPPSTPGLYEWSAGNTVTESLQQVSILPDRRTRSPHPPKKSLLGARFRVPQRDFDRWLPRGLGRRGKL